MGIPFLVLRLEGPLQSWGERSRWDARDSALMPTKSGVVGLLGCAMGYSSDETKKLSDLGKALLYAVRADNPGRLMVDYQTVQAQQGYLLSADGKPRSSGNTIVSRRQYLEGASFTVLFTGDTILLEQCGDALQNPKWPIYLGRKSCVPTRPVYMHMCNYESFEEALSNIPVSTYYRQLTNASPRLLCEIESLEGMQTRRDSFTGVGNARLFDQRRIHVCTVEVNDVSK